MSEVSSLPEPVEAPASPPRRRVRSALAGLLGVLAVVGLLASTVAVWGRAALFNTDRFVAAVDEALIRPEVTAAMAEYLTDQIFVVVDVNNRVGDVLPPALSPLRPAIVGGAHSFVETRLETLLATDTVRDLLSGLVRRTHTALVKLLKGDGLVDGISVANGEVTLNLLPLVGRGLTVAQGLGLFDNVVLPDLSRDGDPAEQISGLEAAFDRDLPKDFGQLVVFRSTALANAEQSVKAAQDAVVVAKRAIWLIIVVTAGLLAMSVFLASRRRRAVVVLALATLVVLVIARLLVQRVVSKVPQLVVDPGARAAAASTLSELTDSLLRLTTVLALVALIAAGVAFLTGPGKLATSIRAQAGTTNKSFRSLVFEHRDGAAAVMFGMSVLVLIVLGLGLFSMLIAAIVALGGVWALWAPDSSPAAE